MYVVTKRGQQCLRKTTLGWNLLVLWKNGEEKWVPFKMMKEYLPVKVVEFAVARGIDEEPAFAWWVSYNLRKRDCIIAAVNLRMVQVTHKYGIEIPRTIEEARLIDAKNGNN